jgi:uncharacterized protein (UPF0212 family)
MVDCAATGRTKRVAVVNADVVVVVVVVSLFVFAAECTERFKRRHAVEC